MEFFTKEETINGRNIRVKIWDTAGQEQYKSLTKNFYRNSDGVIIVYDISDKSTFEKVQEWVQSIEDYTSAERPLQKILVGNKVDLPRQVSTDEGQKLALSKNMPFFEVSAKENIGIENFMRKIIQDVVDGMPGGKKGVGLNEADNSDKAKKGCGC
ncbi:MAG: GTP-binding protein [archaeon]|nr:GTP-binding protein [archaeon]